MIDGGLSREFQSHLPQVHWQRIETGGTGYGIPDLNGCIAGSEFWIESKRTDAWAVKIAPEQIGWAERRIRAGGKVWLAVRRRTEPGPRRGKGRDELWFMPGSLTRHVALYGLHGLLEGVQPFERCPGGPARWPWPALLAMLQGQLPRSK